MEVYDNVLDLIGNTPIVRLPSLNRGLKPNLFAKTWDHYHSKVE